MLGILNPKMGARYTETGWGTHAYDKQVYSHQGNSHQNFTWGWIEMTFKELKKNTVSHSAITVDLIFSINLFYWNACD